MSDSENLRIDEVSKYFNPVVIMKKANNIILFLNVVLSLLMINATSYSDLLKQILGGVFIVITILYFVSDKFLHIFLLPRALEKRRLGMLSDAFNIPLIHEKTRMYYNSTTKPSIERLGVNALENTFFSKSTISLMFKQKVVICVVYFIVWMMMFTIRSTNLELLVLMTQVFFSGTIIAELIDMGILWYHCEDVYKRLYNHFLQHIPEENVREITTILNCVIDYESAKATSGILLSRKIFDNTNDKLKGEWDRIKECLNLNDKVDIVTHDTK